MLAFDPTSVYAIIIYVLGGISAGLTILAALEKLFGWWSWMRHRAAEPFLNESRREHDRARVQDIRTALPRHIVDALLRNQDFGASWPVDWMVPISDLARKNNAEDRFLDARLERRRQELHAVLSDFRRLLNMTTFRSRGDSEWQDVGVVPHGPNDPETKLYEERSEALNDTAAQVADAYDALMEEALRKTLL